MSYNLEFIVKTCFLTPFALCYYYTSIRGEFFVKRLIEKEMLLLGAPTGRLGYAQMVCAIELIMNGSRVISTTHELYPQVAALCGTKPARIERNVREEIRAIWDYGNQERLDSMFYNRDKYPPGNKEFLYTIAKHLEQQIAL